MFASGSRHTRRAGAFTGLLMGVLLVAGACAAAATSTTAGTAVDAALSHAPSPTTEPANLASPTATPTDIPSAPSVAPPGTPVAGAEALQSAMVAIIKQVQPSVVVIETSAGLGSGIVYDSAGHIVTNAHVVGTSKTFKVTLSNGKSYTATLVGSFTADDIAVIKIAAPGLSPATFGDSSKLSVGDFVLAMGIPARPAVERDRRHRQRPGPAGLASRPATRCPT